MQIKLLSPALLLIMLISYPALPATPERIPGKKAYVELRLKAHIWANVLHDFSENGKRLKLSAYELKRIKKDFPLAEEWELERVLRELEKGVRFFLINSRFNLNLALEVDVHREFKLRSEITMGDSPYFTVKDELYKNERDLSREESYDGLIHIERLFHLGKDGKLVRIRGGGGFTWGVDDERKTAGISTWAMTPPSHFSNNFWLFTHEFHHQLDRLFELSGHPEYWFNHFAKPEGTAGIFGEHFDGNAWILRTWPEELFFDLNFGSVKYFEDADEDGIPDNDSSIAFDERRFGSLKTRKDSDADGLTDLEEALLWQWAEPGLGEELSLYFKTPEPLKADADGDGIIDGADILPLYPVSAIVPKLPASSGETQGSRLPARSPSGIASELSLSWWDDGLSILISASEPVELKVLFDALGDGWWKEADNIYLEIGADGTLTKKHVVNGAGEDKWCFDDPSLLGQDSIKVSMDKVEGSENPFSPYSHLYRIFIRADEKYSFSPKDGSVIGLNIGFRKPKAGLPADALDYYTVFFEPNVLKWLVLGGEDETSAKQALRQHNLEVMRFHPPIKPGEEQKENSASI